MSVGGGVCTERSAQNVDRLSDKTGSLSHCGMDTITSDRAIKPGTRQRHTATYMYGAKLPTSQAHAHRTVPSESLPQTSERILLSESSPAYIWLVKQFRRP